MFAGPVLGPITNQQTNVTLEANVAQTVMAGLATGFSLNVNFNSFNHFGQLSGEYKHFEIESFNVDVIYDNPGSDLFCSVAYYPINYLAMAAVSTAPANPRVVDSLPGSVNVMPGSSNRGRWTPAMIKQQFSPTDAGANISGTLYSYISNKGLAAITVGVIIRINCKFYSPAFNNLGTVRVPVLKQEALSKGTEDSSDEEIIVVKKKSLLPSLKVPV